jgi:hypothetical protein
MRTNKGNEMTKYIDAAEVAKLIRETLKVEFKDIKFSVKTKKYSGGASVRVSWVDGPTSNQVDDIVGFYAGSSFDGMQDLKSSVYHTNEAGETIRYGSDYVFCERSLSIEHVKQFADYVLAHYSLRNNRHNDGEVVSNYSYDLRGSEHGGAWFQRPDYSKNVYFGSESFEDYVMNLAREWESFEAFKADEDKRHAESEAFYAEYRAKQAKEEVWAKALEEIETPKEIEDDYVACLMAAGWI